MYICYFNSNNNEMYLKPSPVNSRASFKLSPLQSNVFEDSPAA